MASQEQIRDQILAQRLQSQEFQGRNQPINQQTLSDEELARRLANEELGGPTQPKRSSLMPGQSTLVRLHHVQTRREIGEPLQARYVNNNNVMFELHQRNGMFLSCNRNGGVEFASIQDDSAKFIVTLDRDNSVHLMCKAHASKRNRVGSTGWFLGMSDDGKLFGNFEKSNYSLWMLVAHHPNNSPIVAATPAVSNTGFPGNTDNPLLLQQQTQLSPPRASSTRLIANQGEYPGDSAGKDILMSFFSTSDGLLYLQRNKKYEAAYNLFVRDRNSFNRILYRPDWPKVASRYQDFSKCDITLDNRVIENQIKHETIKSFFEVGYTVVSGLIPNNLVFDANLMVSSWVSSQLLNKNGRVLNFQLSDLGVGERLDLKGLILTDFDLMSLYFNTPLIHLTQKLIGSGDVQHPTSCQITTTYPSSVDIEKEKVLDGTQWYIEGFGENRQHSPFTLLIGIALTDINTSFQGNFCVFPGSHVILLEQYKHQAERNSTLFSENPKNHQKPHLGEPVQLTLKAGDVFLCTQRLAHYYSPNIPNESSLNPTPTTIVYFKISHVDHQVLKDPALDSVWLEYQGASRYLDDPNAGTIITPPEPIKPQNIPANPPLIPAPVNPNYVPNNTIPSHYTTTTHSSSVSSPYHRSGSAEDEGEPTFYPKTIVAPGKAVSKKEGSEEVGASYPLLSVTSVAVNDDGNDDDQNHGEDSPLIKFI